MNKILLPLGGHLLVCMIIAAFTVDICWLLPPVMPYLIPLALAGCLGVMSIWDVNTFNLGARHLFGYLIIIALLVVAFLAGVIDWIFGFGQIPVPWRYVVVFESLPLAFIFFIFFALIIDCEDVSPARGHYEARPISA